jgi:hypothetical protein
MALKGRKPADARSKVLRRLEEAVKRGEPQPTALTGEDAKREAERANRQAREEQLERWGLKR